MSHAECCPGSVLAEGSPPPPAGLTTHDQLRAAAQMAAAQYAAARRHQRPWSPSRRSLQTPAQPGAGDACAHCGSPPRAPSSRKPSYGANGAYGAAGPQWWATPEPSRSSAQLSAAPAAGDPAAATALPEAVASVDGLPCYSGGAVLSSLRRAERQGHTSAVVTLGGLAGHGSSSRRGPRRRRYPQQVSPVAAATRPPGLTDNGSDDDESVARRGAPGGVPPGVAEWTQAASPPRLRDELRAALKDVYNRRMLGETSASYLEVVFWTPAQDEVRFVGDAVGRTLQRYHRPSDDPNGTWTYAGPAIGLAVRGNTVLTRDADDGAWDAVSIASSIAGQSRTALLADLKYLADECMVPAEVGNPIDGAPGATFADF